MIALANKETLKLAAYAAGAIVLAYIVYRVIKRLKLDDLVKSANKDIDKQDLSYSPTTYEGFADAIYSAMDGSSAAEAPNSVAFNAFKQMKTQSDVNATIKAYGKRRLRFFGLPDGNKKNLIEALSSENLLSNVRKILKSKGLTI